MGEHPTILELELWRAGEAGAGIGDHVAACAACRDEIDFLERLARDQGAARPAFAAPDALEEAMAARAGRHAARVRAALVAGAAAGERRRLLRAAPWIAAAAAVVALGTAGVLWRAAATPAPAAEAPARAASADDVNRDGRVDVLDAFALARAVEAGAGRPEWDRNRDGAVDRADVDAVALAAVALGRGTR
jgi:hypothetical protein